MSTNCCFIIISPISIWTIILSQWDGGCQLKTEDYATRNSNCQNQVTGSLASGEPESFRWLQLWLLFVRRREQSENVFFAQTFFIKLKLLREPMEVKHKHVYTFLCVSFSKVSKHIKALPVAAVHPRQPVFAISEI